MRNNIYRAFFFVFIHAISFTPAGAAELCAVYQVAFKQPDTPISKRKLCFDPETTRVQTPDCKSKRSCAVVETLAQLLKLDPELKRHLLPRDASGPNPGYALCEKMKLMPRSAIVVTDKFQVSTWVCYSPADRSFIDFGTLTEMTGFGGR